MRAKIKGWRRGAGRPMPAAGSRCRAEGLERRLFLSASPFGADQLLGGVGANRVSAGSIYTSLVLNQSGEADTYSGVPGMLFQAQTTSSDVCLDPVDFANAVG